MDGEPFTLSRGVSDSSVWQEVANALQADFPHEKPHILVLDDYQAKYLELQLPDYKVDGLYSYLSQRWNFSIASGTDIYEAFQKALQKVLPNPPPLPFLEGWSYAQHLAEDIREILLSLSPLGEMQDLLKPLRSAWQEVANEKALQETFALKGEDDDLPWLQVLPLPRTYPGPVMRTLQQELPQIAENFLNYLWEKKRKVLGEELFMQKPLREKVVLWNIFSPEKRIQEWIQYQVHQGHAQVWGWDIHPLQECLGKPLWPLQNASPSTQMLYLPRTFSPCQARKAELKNSYRTITELLEEASKEVVDAYKQGKVVGVWIGDAKVKAIFEHILRDRGFTGPALTHPTLLDTQIGTFLREAYRAGKVPSVDRIPLPETEEPAEREAFRLYSLFYQGAEGRNLMGLLHFLRFLGRQPMPLPWPSPSANLLSGTLAQLSGLTYEKLFVLLPSADPLGPWFRPSFLPAPIRARYYPPTYRSYTAWRLLTLLLYGAQETYIYQLAGQENQSPLEEFLTYVPRKYPCLKEIWAISVNPTPPKVPSYTGPSPEPLLPLPASGVMQPPQAISPTDLYSFLQCPRQYYLAKVARLPEDRPSVQALLGTWLHEGLRAALVGFPFPPKGPYRRPQHLFLDSLSILKKLWAPRRLYRILRRAYYRVQRHNAPILPPLSQNPEARFYLRLWADSGRIFYKHIRDHYPKASTSPPQFPLILYPEVWLNGSIAPLHEPTLRGRLDLLITSPNHTPFLAIDYKTGPLPKDIAELASFADLWQKTLQSITTTNLPPQKIPNRIDFQAFTYVMNFPSPFALIVANAISPSNYAVYQLSEWEQTEVRRLWQASFRLLESRWKDLIKVLAHSSEPARQAEIATLFPMTTNEQSCKYCPYKLLCQRL